MSQRAFQKFGIICDLCPELWRYVLLAPYLGYLFPIGRHLNHNEFEESIYLGSYSTQSHVAIIRGVPRRYLSEYMWVDFMICSR